jgi:hypothetical protein
MAVAKGLAPAVYGSTRHRWTQPESVADQVGALQRADQGGIYLPIIDDAAVNELELPKCQPNLPVASLALSDTWRPTRRVPAGISHRMPSQGEPTSVAPVAQCSWRSVFDSR